MNKAVKESGYTIIEVMVVMFILMATMAAVLPWFYTNLTQTVRVQGRLESIEQGRTALRHLGRELRQANKLVNIVDRPTGKDSISFEADLNADGAINSCLDTTLPPECATYVVKGSSLIRGRKSDTGNTVATGITKFKVEYFGSNPELDSNGDGLVSGGEIGPDLDGDDVPDNLNLFLDRISMIRLTMTFKVRKQEVTVTQDVGMRNLNKVSQNL